jgi:hypothetical protein
VAGNDVFCFDWDANIEIEDGSASFSHSALIAAFFNGTLDAYADRFADRWTSFHERPAPELPLTRYCGLRTQEVSR